MFISWLYYSSPGRRSFSEADYQVAPQIEFTQMWTDAGLQNQPVWVYGEVSASLSTKVAGFFILRHEGNDLIVLARDITPGSKRQVKVLLIPRELVMIQDQEYLLGAMIRYQYLDDVVPVGTGDHNPFSLHSKKTFSYVKL
ncbi:hypothetical protein CRP01_04510 [Flavilitoribacter nigricans DSM 23189 = NBRC 102662]|uniref:Uncharacterized protein n=1 Tax=Flavilitoribacter nigricans (strain ATCC 23147 / DSM 23189 / NBRC 102662 / NCIMB 1420 / SS-2) TaxID=1122177 RepID=A0A2D0NH28_FLAN2|nr:hypothetical protein CRP01_04510 [Flavilitoribacter nigricans DSM 23189 = NBRC 102662]